MNSTRKQVTTVVVSAMALALVVSPALSQGKQAGTAQAKKTGTMASAAKSD
jgi:hypothetical protein